MPAHAFLPALLLRLRPNRTAPHRTETEYEDDISVTRRPSGILRQNTWHTNRRPSDSLRQILETEGEAIEE